MQLDLRSFEVCFSGTFAQSGTGGNPSDLDYCERPKQPCAREAFFFRGESEERPDIAEADMHCWLTPSVGQFSRFSVPSR
jgi:hypothetical protein